MKTVLLHEYKTKKVIADNLQSLINKRFLDISDEEFTRINDAIDDYNEAAETEFNHLNEINAINANTTEINNRLTQLELDLESLKDATPVEVEETGLYFVDDDGYVGAKITNEGFFAINLDPTNNGGNGGSSSSISGDLTVIDY